MTDERIRYLQQIPAFALRQLVNDRYRDPEGEALLAARLRSALGRRPRRPRRSVMRLTRQELTKLIGASPEIGDDEIAACFEEYRYGSSPSFYVYLFDPALLAPDRLVDFDRRLAQALVDDNARFADDVGSGLPPLRDVLLNDFAPLPGAPGLHEGTYRFLSRLDYIDADENAVSTYETLYGFFWISVTDGYATIHARKPQVLSSLRLAIEEAAGVPLTPLVISKQFKNALRFLEQERFQSSRLYEPNPDAERFRWLTIADRRAYHKGYADLERSYPELRSTRYRVTVDDKETTVSLTCDHGALSLAGRLQASQFRAWAIGSLGEVIRVLTEFRAAPAAYVQTYGLRGTPPMAAYATAQQKDLVIELLSAVLTLKQSRQEIGTLRRPATEFALAFRSRDDLALMLACDCPEPTCGEESYWTCPVCDEPFLSLSEQEGELWLACQRRAQHWQVQLPAEAPLACGHQATIDTGTLRDDLELLPGQRLLDTLAALVNGHLSGYEYRRNEEGFFIRGSILHYYPERDAWLAALPTAGGKTVVVNRVIQHIQNLYGTAIGVLEQ